MNRTLSARMNVAMGARAAGIVLGIPIDRKSLEEVAEEALQAINRRISQRVFVCANPHSLVVSQADPTFRSAMMRASLVVADGVGLSLMARLVGIEIGPRITGTDYFQAVLNALQQRGGGRVFFFGSSQSTLNLMAKRFATDFPSLTLCGTLSPPFRLWSEEENRRMVQVINDAKPDVLWVGMTAPKQEKWVEGNRRQLNAPVIGSIGAVFDFYAGTCARAPQLVCRMGLEWIYRLMMEPGRMWRRSFISSPIFVWLMIRRHVLGRSLFLKNEQM